MNEEPRAAIAAGEPVLVYDRVAANRRHSRLLLIALGVLTLPLVGTLSALLMPFLVEVGSVFFMVVSGLGEEWLRRQTSAILVKWAFVALALSVLSCVAAMLVAARHVGGRLLLRFSGARPLDPAQFPQAARAAARLSAGAGLPRPSLAFIDNPAPNSFAVGKTRDKATVAVTRGLLTLLDRREIEAVLAHEVAHIGNEDTRLNGTLAVLVATLTWPVTLPLRLVRSKRPIVACVGWVMVTGVALTALGGLWWLANIGTVVSDLWELVANPETRAELGLMLPVIVASSVAPLYIVLVGPAVALALRRALGRQREFLADGEAVLLTRDPEGLAIALAKIGAATGALRGADVIAHMFIVDPFGNAAPLLSRLFPTHPPIAARIAMLSREGPGIDPAILKRAMEAGEQYRSSLAPAPAPMVSPPAAGAGGRTTPTPGPSSAPRSGEGRRGEQPDGQVSAAEHWLPVYEAADGWSRVIAHVSPESPLNRVDSAAYGNFVKVQTPDGLVGYVSGKVVSRE